ncbi:MAG TPA: MBL fold metallo-hydrolase [Acidimicrobiia bacterium]|nr:MBL fold metallo-hydrolase [Acidimicrobiia bacterium]
MELTVLGCSGSYGAPAGGACSGYLLRTAGANLWLDCGNGTLANLQRHCPVEDLTALVITHWHPDHCADIYGLHVLFRYGLGRTGFPVFAPDGTGARLATLVDGDWGGTFAWTAVGDGDAVTVDGCGLRFSRTAHPPPTLAVEATADGKRLVYTADTGPGWSVEAFDPGADLVLSEASLQGTGGPKGAGAIHLSARQAGEAARAAGARRLMLTHLWPGLDPMGSVVEGSEAFGREVLLAAPNQRTRI